MDRKEGGILHIALFTLIRIACFVWVRLGDCGEVMVCYFFCGFGIMMHAELGFFCCVCVDFVV